jgi:hypothetical protein
MVPFPPVLILPDHPIIVAELSIKQRNWATERLRQPTNDRELSIIGAAA